MSAMSAEKKLKEIFKPEIIEFLKNNKDQITSELLQELRSFGNPGKHLALEILDFPKDSEQYYLDSFGNRMSVRGNRSLKKPFTKLNLSPIHIEELERCSNDIHYFKDNYVKIRTKSGVNFPDMRQYQNEFISLLKSDEESIVGLMGRQSSKSISTSIYANHLIIFDKEKNIGIVANKAGLAREFLLNIKNIFLELPIWMKVGVESWNKSFVEFENGVRCLTDVPSQDSFRGFSIHCAIMDETAFIRPSIFNEFIDAFLPSQAALSWKKNIILSTPKGQNHFFDIVKGASLKYAEEGSGIKEKGTSGYVLFKVDWRDVPRYDKEGNLYKPEEFKKSIVDKHGLIYWNQNFACEFLGSSHTLINASKMAEFNTIEPLEIRDGKLKIYKYPQQGHRYICAVDSAKDGIDDFSVQIIDITDFKFEQVASAQLQIDYLLMPEYINEWCEYYNKPYLIIENNEGSGQSIADQMKLTYEYENLHYDKKVDTNFTNITKSQKRYPGFRTTGKSRKLILQTLKLFIENNNLIIYDKKTINQFYTFILINNKYQADENCKDDAIMSLAMIFVPFCNSKNFDDMKGLIDRLYSDDSEYMDDDKTFIEFLNIGSFDDGTDITEDSAQRNYNGYNMEPDGFY